MSVLALLCGDCKAILDTEECETHEVSSVSEFWGQRQVGHYIVGPLCPCCAGDDLKRVQLCECGDVSAEGCADCDTCYELRQAPQAFAGGRLTNHRVIEAKAAVAKATGEP